MLLPETRQAFRDLWDVEISEAYAMSEGLFSRDCDHGAIHLPDDLVIVEPVDEDRRAVAPDSSPPTLRDLFAWPSR